MRVKAYIITLMLGAMMTSCVTMEKYSALESRNDQLNKQHEIMKDELAAARSENKRLMDQIKQMRGAITQAELDIANLQQSLENTKKQYAYAKDKYDETVSKYMKQLSGTNANLTSARRLLEDRKKELNDKESRLEILEKEYQERKERMDDLLLKLEDRDNELKRAIGQRTKSISDITDKVAKAMVGFESKGLKIDIKDDKLYITLEDRLLFAKGSWEVSAEGLKALAKLSEVLEANPDVDVVVEGHTASLAYTGKNEVKDNWDLSVMRATSVVKVLLKNKNINPNHITASGKAGFDPKAAPRQNPNINSRTEIILTPKYVDIIDILSTGKNAATVDVDTQIGE